jgi:hypothetical protein
MSGGSPTAALRQARTCYDHLAGELGVAVTEALVSRHALVVDDGPGFQLGPHAESIFASLGVNLAGSVQRRGGRPLLRSCLDWTERRPHLAGGLGASLASTMIANGWISRHPSRRSVELTPDGARRLADALGIEHYR